MSQRWKSFVKELNGKFFLVSNALYDSKTYKSIFKNKYILTFDKTFNFKKLMKLELTIDQLKGLPVEGDVWKKFIGIEKNIKKD